MGVAKGPATAGKTSSGSLHWCGIRIRIILSDKAVPEQKALGLEEVMSPGKKRQDRGGVGKRLHL